MIICRNEMVRVANDGTSSDARLTRALEAAGEARESRMKILDRTVVDILPQDFEPLFDDCTIRLQMNTNFEALDNEFEGELFVDMKTLQCTYREEGWSERRPGELDPDLLKAVSETLKMQVMLHKNRKQVLFVDKKSNLALLQYGHNGELDLGNAFFFSLKWSDMQQTANGTFVFKYLSDSIDDYDDNDAGEIYYVDHANKQLQLVYEVPGGHYPVSLDLYEHNGYLYLGVDDCFVRLWVDLLLSRSQNKNLPRVLNAVCGRDDMSEAVQSRGPTRYLGYPSTWGFFFFF